MGRYKKTEAERKLEGNRSQRPIPEELEVDTNIDCPSDLTENQTALWHRLAPDQKQAKRLHAQTQDSFRLLVVYLDRIYRVNRELDSDESRLWSENMWVDAAGQEHYSRKESPESKLARDLLRAVLPLLEKFNLTPDKAAGVFKPKEEKPFAEEMLDA